MGSWGPGEDVPERNKDELRELVGRSEANELGEPGTELSSLAGGEEGVEGSDTIEVGDAGADAVARTSCTRAGDLGSLVAMAQRPLERYTLRRMIISALDEFMGVVLVRSQGRD